MSGLSRQLKRRNARANGVPWPSRSQRHRELPDGGYEALHPTRGWKRFSAKRLMAQFASAGWLGGR